MHIKKLISTCLVLLIMFCTGTINAQFLAPDSVRIVNPATGEINQAILTNPQRLNLYAYGLNNPYRYIDPDGNSPLLLIPLAAAVLTATNPDNANAPPSSSAPVYESHGTRNILIEGAVSGATLGVAGKLIPVKGLITPSKYFGSKTYKGAEKALNSKFGAPRGGGKYNKSFYNAKTGRTYNLHKDPAHRGGKGHIDIRKRNLPTNHYKDRPFYLKKE